MELQLSLALPIHTPTNGFDLNTKVEFEPEDLLGSFGCCSKEIDNHFKRKHGNFPLEAFGQGEVSSTETFPLVSWNHDDPNEEDDLEKNERKKRNTDSGHGEYGETSFLAGWPPINQWRKKLIHEYQGGGIAEDDHRMVERRGGGRTNSVFVKVKMEGVAIGRKIDLNLYHSYQMLRITLINMFAKYQEDEKDGAGYTLLYQDRQGNWLLAGEVPWQTFMESVQRMEVVRNDGARS